MLTTLEDRVSTLEDTQSSHTETLVSEQLHLEDMEVQSHRNSLRLWGLPGATGTEDLAATAIAIFHNVAGTDLPERVDLDWIHRHWAPDRVTPRDPTT